MSDLKILETLYKIKTFPKTCNLSKLNDVIVILSLDKIVASCRNNINVMASHREIPNKWNEIRLTLTSKSKNNSKSDLYPFNFDKQIFEENTPTLTYRMRKYLPSLHLDYEKQLFYYKLTLMHLLNITGRVHHGSFSVLLAMNASIVPHLSSIKRGKLIWIWTTLIDLRGRTNFTTIASILTIIINASRKMTSYIHDILLTFHSEN